jgi:hypothetical protein
MISQVIGYWLNQVKKILVVLARILRILFSKKNTHVLQKKVFQSNFAFLTNFKVKLVAFRKQSKYPSVIMLQIFSKFQIFHQKSVLMMLKGKN